MTERDANQLAADVRAGLTEARHSGGSVEEGEEFKLGCPVCDAILALDELVGLVGTLQQERDEARAAFAIDLEMKARAEAAEAALATTRQALAPLIVEMEQASEGKPDDYVADWAARLRALADTGGDTE